MEAWVIACIVFVFAALMEYTGILLQVLDDADGDIHLVFSCETKMSLADVVIAAGGEWSN